MAKRVPVQTIIVYRDGKRVAPPIGKPYDFTADEIKSINDRNPDASRKVTDESKPAEDGDDETALQEAEAAAADKAAKAAAAKKGTKPSVDDDL